MRICVMWALGRGKAPCPSRIEVIGCCSAERGHERPWQASSILQLCQAMQEGSRRVYCEIPTLQFITLQCFKMNWLCYVMLLYAAEVSLATFPGPDVYCPESWAIADFSGAAAHCHSTPVAGIPIQAWVRFFLNFSWVCLLILFIFYCHLFSLVSRRCRSFNVISIHFVLLSFL